MTTSTIQIETEPAIDDDGFGMLGVHVGCAQLERVKDFFPNDHPISMFMLCRILELALPVDKTDRPGIACEGTFFDGIVLALLRDPVAAVERTRSELETVAIDGICQIGILTASGWICVHPGPWVRMRYLMDTERFELFTEQFLERARARMRSLRASPPSENIQDSPG